MLRAAALAMVLLAVPAVATTRVGVLPFAPLAGDVPQGAGEKGADILAKELKNQADFEVVPREEAAAQDGAAAISQARQKVTDARAAVTKHQGMAALAAYQAALAGFAKGIQDLESFDDFVAAEAEMGTLLYRMGRDDEGQKAILDSLRLSANQPSKAFGSSPAFAATLEGLQKQLSHLGKGSVRVESTPSGADVFVDGQSAGKAPVLLRDLPAGKHYLRALLPSGEKWGLVVDVAPSSEPHVRAQTGGAGPGGEVDGQLAENSLQPTILPALKKAASASKLGLVIFGALHRTINGLALDAFVYSADKGSVARLSRVKFDAEMLEAGLQMDKIVAEVQHASGGSVTLPSKASPDLTAERELATEFHFGGTPDAPIEQPVTANPEEQAPAGSRVIRKQQDPQDAE
jgi:PEGA domain